MTLLAQDHVPAKEYAAVAAEYSPDEIAALVSLLVAINAWNRMAISFRDLHGGYQPGQFNHLLERQAH